MELFEEILLHHLKKNQGAQGFPQIRRRWSTTRLIRR